MNNISHTNFQELCRACLRTLKETNFKANSVVHKPNPECDDRASSQLKSLLLPNLCKLFMLLTTYDVNNEDKDFPKRLCEWCYDRLVDYDKFRTLVIKSSETLYERWNVCQAEEESSEREKGDVVSPVKFVKHEDEEINDDELLLPELANIPIDIKTESNFEATETQLILPSLAEGGNINDISNAADENVINKELLAESSKQSLNPSEKNLNSNKVNNGKRLHYKACNKNFHKDIYVEAHMRVTHNNPKKMFECSVCNKAFTRLHLLTDHMKLKHNEELIDHIESSQENQLELSHFCHICRRNYSSKRALKEHIKRHKKIKDHVCQECGVAKVTRTELVTHMRTHTPNLEKFSCPQCPQVFNHKNAISRHVKVVHEGLRRYQCTYCPKRFGTRNSQVGHERLHTGEKPFICNICTKGYAQQEGLKSHMKNHYKKDNEKRQSSDTPHICNICSKSFDKYEEFRVHLFTHFEIGTDENPENISNTTVGG